MAHVSWCDEERTKMCEAMCIMYNLAVSRVSRRVVDNEKLSMVADMMDEWTRSENLAYIRLNDDLFRKIDDLREMLAREQEMNRDLIEQCVALEQEVERLRIVVEETESDVDSELEFLERPDVRRQLFPP